MRGVLAEQAGELLGVVAGAAVGQHVGDLGLAGEVADLGAAWLR